MAHTYFYQLELSVTKIKDAKILKECYVKYPFLKLFIYIFIYLWEKVLLGVKIHFHLIVGKTTLVIKNGYSKGSVKMGKNKVPALALSKHS